MTQPPSSGRAYGRLRTTLIAGFVAIALFDIGFTAYEVRESHAFHFAVAEREVANRTLALEENVVRAFGEVDRLLADAADDVALVEAVAAQGAPRLREHLARASGRLPQIQSLFAVTREGAVVNLGPDRPADAAAALSLQHAVTAKSAQFGLAISATAEAGSGRTLVSLGRGFDGGVIGATIDMEHYAVAHRRLVPGDSGMIALFHEDGTLLLSHPARLGPQQTARLRAAIETALVTGPLAGTVVGEVLEAGRQHAMSYRRLGTLPVVVVGASDMQEALANWREEESEQVALAAFILAALGGVLLLLLRQLRQAEAREARLRLAQHSIDQAGDMILWIGADGRIRYANQTTGALLGDGGVMLTGRPIGALLAGLDEAAWSRCWSKLRVQGQIGFEAELCDSGAAGFTVDVALSLVAYDGEPLGCAVCRDISGRKRAEAALRALSETLESRVRERTLDLESALKELQAFSYSVSHDLLAPLRALNGFATILQHDYAERLDGQGRDYLERMRRAALRMSELIDGLLSLSRVSRQPLRREPADLSGMVQEVLEECRHQEPQRRVDIAVEPRMVVDGDVALVRSLVQNLVLNAWKYSSRREHARIEVGRLAGRGESIFYVRDNGVGFDMRYADKLFGAFQRMHAREQYDGIGIGLATAKRIVDRHGGRIWAESAPEQGATFYFTLGAAQPMRLADAA